MAFLPTEVRARTTGESHGDVTMLSGGAALNQDHVLTREARARKWARKDHQPGERFGRLVIVKPMGQRAEVLCDCGTSRVVLTGNLRSGDARSCGCLYRETRGNKTFTHHGCGTSIYKIWCGIQGRCLDPKDRAYPRYGAKGIGVCERWQGFVAFREDMGERPGRLTVDRKDNDGGYWCGKCEECVRLGRPANCRWATYAEQHRNRSTNRWLEFGGESMVLTDWAARLGVTPSCIARRLAAGWPLGRSLTEPSRSHRNPSSPTERR